MDTPGGQLLPLVIYDGDISDVYDIRGIITAVLHFRHNKNQIISLGNCKSSPNHCKSFSKVDDKDGYFKEKLGLF